MFRVSYSGTAKAWSLFGRLAGPWVEEMRSSWKSARERAPLTRAIADLKEVTLIDQSGERQLIASGLAHQHLLETLSVGGTAQEGENK